MVQSSLLEPLPHDPRNAPSRQSARDRVGSAVLDVEACKTSAKCRSEGRDPARELFGTSNSTLYVRRSIGGDPHGTCQERPESLVLAGRPSIPANRERGNVRALLTRSRRHRWRGLRGLRRCRAASRCLRRPRGISPLPPPLRGWADRTWCRAGCLP